MTYSKHNLSSAYPPSAWMRLLASLGVLLLLVASCQQAAHDHFTSGLHRAAQVSRSTHGAPPVPAEAACPLCIAMHGTLPATAPILLAAASPVSKAVAALQRYWIQRFQHFARFGRPPPATLLS